MSTTPRSSRPTYKQSSHNNNLKPKFNHRPKDSYRSHQGRMATKRLRAINSTMKVRFRMISHFQSKRRIWSLRRYSSNSAKSKSFSKSLSHWTLLVTRCLSRSDMQHWCRTEKNSRRKRTWIASTALQERRTATCSHPLSSRRLARMALGCRRTSSTTCARPAARQATWHIPTSPWKFLKTQSGKDHSLSTQIATNSKTNQSRVWQEPFGIRWCRSTRRSCAGKIPRVSRSRRNRSLAIKSSLLEFSTAQEGRQRTFCGRQLTSMFTINCGRIKMTNRRRLFSINLLNWSISLHLQATRIFLCSATSPTTLKLINWSKTAKTSTSVRSTSSLSSSQKMSMF